MLELTCCLHPQSQFIGFSVVVDVVVTMLLSWIAVRTQTNLPPVLELLANNPRIITKIFDEECLDPG